MTMCHINVKGTSIVLEMKNLQEMNCNFVNEEILTRFSKIGYSLNETAL